MGYSAIGRRGRRGDVHPHVRQEAEKFQKNFPPIYGEYDADDIMSAFEYGYELAIAEMKGILAQ